MERAGPHWVDIPQPQKSYAIPELLSDHVEFSTRVFLGNSEHRVQARRYWVRKPEYRMIGSISRPVISSTEAVRAVFPLRRAHQRESQATLDPLVVIVMNSPGSPVPQAKRRLHSRYRGPSVGSRQVASSVLIGPVPVAESYVRDDGGQPISKEPSRSVG